MKWVAIIGGFGFCLFVTAGLLRPEVLQGKYYPVSTCEDARWVDTGVSIVITLTLWIAWVAFARLSYQDDTTGP